MGEFLPQALSLNVVAIQCFAPCDFENQWIAAIRPRAEEEIELLLKLSEKANRLVVDGFHPEFAGGAGVVGDWDIAKKVKELTNKQLLLAGGLTPENVSAAIAQVRPDGVDVSSGIESSQGIKDRDKMREFISRAKQTVI